MVAADIMSTGLVTVRPDDTVDEVTRKMLETGVSSVSVVDDEGRVLGIVSENELIRLLLPPYVDLLGDVAFLPEDFQPFQELLAHAGDVLVNQIMNRDYVWATENTTVAEIATLMLTKNTRRVLILRDGRLVGTIGRRDVLEEILTH